MMLERQRDASVVCDAIEALPGEVMPSEAFEFVEAVRRLGWSAEPIPLPADWSLVEDDDGAPYPHAIQLTLWALALTAATAAADQERES